MVRHAMFRSGKFPAITLWAAFWHLKFQCSFGPSEVLSTKPSKARPNRLHADMGLGPSSIKRSAS